MRKILIFQMNSLYLISKKADGSMRDALSLLEQVVSFCGDDFSEKNISEA